MNKLSIRWQKLIIWLTGYLNIIAFVVAGGYVFLKTEHEDVKKSAKLALFTVSVFTAKDILFAFIRNFLNIANASSGWLNTTTQVFAIVEIVVFVTLFVVDMINGFGKVTMLADGSDCKSESKTAE